MTERNGVCATIRVKRPIGIIPTSHRDLCRLWDYIGISWQSLFSVVLREIRDKAGLQAAFLTNRFPETSQLFRDLLGNIALTLFLSRENSM